MLTRFMRLTIDLRFNPQPHVTEPGERAVTLRDLVELAPRPAQLWRLLRGERYEVVRVLVDKRPMSGVQAGGLGLAALARGTRFETESETGVRPSGHAAFLGRAIRTFVVAGPKELLRTTQLIRRARGVAAMGYVIPPPARRPVAVTYVRADPTLLWLGAQVGGAATHTAGVINGLIADGLAVHVFAPEAPAGIAADVPVTEVPLRGVYYGVPWLTFFDYSSELVEAASHTRPDFVYQRYALGSYAGLELARRLRVPLILEFNGSEIWTARNWGDARLPFVETLAALERRNLEDASLIVVNSDVMRDQLVDQGIEVAKVLVNPNGVDVDRLAPLRALDARGWRARLGRSDVPTIGFVGTFGLWHGVTVLPEMIEGVHAARPDARWVLVGDGPLRDEVEADVERRGLAEIVEFAGARPHEETLELLASSDICVSPHIPNPDGSRFFGSPTKLFEYMGLAKPIVASDLEQIGEVLDDGRSALLCPPGDADAAVSAVLRLIEDPQLAATLGRAALSDAAERYSWNAHVRRILDALVRLGPAGASEHVS